MFRFPVDHKGKAWIKCLQLKQEQASNPSVPRVCKRHFMSSDFYVTEEYEKMNIQLPVNDKNTCSPLRLKVLEDVDHNYSIDIRTLKETTKRVHFTFKQKKHSNSETKKTMHQTFQWNYLKSLRQNIPRNKKFRIHSAFLWAEGLTILRKKIPLPHPSSIRRWMMNIDSSPGFSAQAIDYLKNKQIGYSNYEKCSLIIDGMSIKKQIEWDNRLPENGTTTCSAPRRQDIYHSTSDKDTVKKGKVITFSCNAGLYYWSGDYERACGYNRKFLGDNVLSYVGAKNVTCQPEYLMTYYVPAESQITVEANDILAVHSTASNTLYVSNCNGYNLVPLNLSTIEANTFSELATKTVSGTYCFIPSFGARLTPGK
ncbi:hypothetical protein Btru_076573 [Bulinus truncatus]|nr:hypothetical protein Btru_076573 [Bulinus truncatus]